MILKRLLLLLHRLAKDTSSYLLAAKCNATGSELSGLLSSADHWANIVELYIK